MTTAEQLVRDLRRRTRALVDEARIGRRDLAEDADVSYIWLCRFLAEHPDAVNPRMNTLARLEKSVSELESLQ